MGMKYESREGSLGATVDTWVQLATLYEETAPGPLFVPSNKTKIKQILVSVGDETPTAAAIGTNIIVKLTGGVATGEQTFAVDGYNDIWATAGANGMPGVLVRLDVDIDCKPNEIISIFGLATGGVCAGSPEVGVTLGFA